MQELPEKHAAEIVEEAIFRRVEQTIAEYVRKNQAGFAANKIAGIQWKLQLQILHDNLGLNPQPKPNTLSQRFISIISRFRKWFSAPRRPR